MRQLTDPGLTNASPYQLAREWQSVCRAAGSPLLETLLFRIAGTELDSRQGPVDRP